jgi:hypothetical protein
MQKTKAHRAAASGVCTPLDPGSAPGRGPQAARQDLHADHTCLVGDPVGHARCQVVRRVAVAAAVAAAVGPACDTDQRVKHLCAVPAAAQRRVVCRAWTADVNLVWHHSGVVQGGCNMWAASAPAHNC